MTNRKKVLLYSPLLWMRKVIVYLLITAIVVGLTLYFIVNSALVVRKVASIYAPDYNITYGRIHGNVLSGVKIEDLAYNDDPLAKHITLKWNPSGLFKKTIIVNTLRVEKANVDTIKSLTASFASDENNQSEAISSSESIDIGVKVDHLSLTLEPFIEQGIKVSDVILNVNGVGYTSDSVDVRKLALQLDTDVTDLILNASLKDGHLNVRELIIEDVDTLALKKLLIPDTNKSSANVESDVSGIVEDTTSKDEPVNPLIPKWVYLDKLEVSILPLIYNPVDIKQLKLTGRDAVFDVENLLLQKANVDLNTRTNLSNIRYKTKIKNNKLIGKVDFKPKKALFKLYELPIRREAVGNIVLDLNVSRSMISSDLQIKMEQILKADKDDFNLDIDNLHINMEYDIKKNSMKAKSDLLLTTPYAKDVLVTNLFTMDKHISYSGEIQAKQIIGVDAKFVKPLNNLQISYEGDTKSISTDINADNLQGTFISPDFKKAQLHLENKEALVLNEFIELPTELNQTKANIVIDAPISFEENASMVAYAKIDSNVLHMDVNVSYKDKLQVKAVSQIPEESLLRAYSEALKWDSLNPIMSEIELLENSVDVQLTTGTLKVNAQYDLNTTQVDGKVMLGGLNADLSGKVEEQITIDTKINSINTLIQSVKDVYTLGDIPDVKGSADISVDLTNLKTVDIALKSPSIMYHPDHKTVHPINDIDFLIHIDESKAVLKHYTLTYATQKLFSTKPSTVSFKDDNVSIAPLWLNDQIEVVGEYDMKTKKGTIDAEAEKLHIAQDVIEFDSNIDINTVLDGNKTYVHGKMIILGGTVLYDSNQKTFASDSDIIIVQDIENKKENSFKDNLSASIQIETKKPLVHKMGDIDIQAKVDLNLQKAEFGELMVVGAIELLEGGSYIFEGKKFVFDKSYLYYTGKPTKPLIEASATYKASKHLITITAMGTVDAPTISFSSKPSLTKEQILSLILFDTEAGAGTNSGNDMMRMMGGAIAKSAISTVGVEVDHFVVGEDNSLEVGKKLTDNLLFTYINDIISSVELKYIHGRHTESVINVSPVSISYDIIYSREF